MTKWLRSPITTSQDLSAGALLYTTSIGRNFRLEKIYFKASVAITETITITLDYKQGANYDIVLRVKGLSSESSFIYVPEGFDAVFLSGDEIKIQCTNANLTGTIYVEVKTSELQG